MAVCHRDMIDFYIHLAKCFANLSLCAFDTRIGNDWVYWQVTFIARQAYGDDTTGKFTTASIESLDNNIWCILLLAIMVKTRKN